MDMPVALLHGLGPQPEQRFALPGTKSHKRGEAGSAADIILHHEQFVQPAPAQPAAQRAVDPVMPQRDMIARCSRTTGFQSFELPLQA